MSPIETFSATAVLAYVALFAILTARAAQKSGRSLWLFGKGADGQALPAFLFRLSFTGATLYVLATLLMSNTRAEPVHDAFGGRACDLIGSVFVLVGAALAVYSQNYMGRSWRIGAASGQLGNIVRTGPFAHSRNPVFVGQVTLFAGIAIVLPSIFQLVLTLSLILAVHLQVRIEERVLEHDLGADYQTYRRDVRRWL